MEAHVPPPPPSLAAPSDDTRDEENITIPDPSTENDDDGDDAAASKQGEDAQEEDLAANKDEDLSLPPISGRPRKTGLYLFIMDISRRVFKLDELGSEIMRIAVPAALALAADPLASLVDTAFIGRLGSVEIAAVGVSIAIFNQVSKVCIYPLVSVTTSFVAEEDAIISKAINEVVEHKTEDLEKAYSPADDNDLNDDLPPCATTDSKTNCGASCLAAECTNLSRYGCKRKYIPSVSSALIVGGVLGLLQTVFLIFAAKLVLSIMGVKSGSPMLNPALRYLMLRSLGAPAVLLSLAMQGVFRGFKDTRTPLYATVAGDATNIILDPILIFVSIWALVVQQLLMLFLRFLLLARVIAVTFCVTLAASLAAHHGPTVMAAFQICSQLWLATSLLADGLAVAGQAVLASAFAKKDHRKVVTATARVLQVAVAAVSIPCLIVLSSHHGFIGIWIALTIYMSLRTIASNWRYDILLDYYDL
uniref:Protein DETOXIFICATION n=1 Tax=Ananas comosus var. bracteatus TaxID=296719 RepID=A0A6V7Q3K1_ANACO|nr:unnamed protein product [Ananas comosus var. bracteatus]